MSSIGLFLKVSDSQIPLPWLSGKTWWFDVVNLTLKVWDGMQWVPKTPPGSNPPADSIWVMCPVQSGRPKPNANVLIHKPTVDILIPTGAPLSTGVALDAPTATTTFDMKKASGAGALSSFGTMQWAVGAKFPTFTVASNTAFLVANDDYMVVTAPGLQDATFANFGFSIHALR